MLFLPKCRMLPEHDDRFAIIAGFARPRRRHIAYALEAGQRLARRRCHALPAFLA